MADKARMAVLMAVMLGWLSTAAGAAEFTGKVVAVHDGEVVSVQRDGRPEPIRLHGVECPDKDKRLAKRAKQYLTKLALGQTVTVVTLEPDMDGRLISDVFLPSGDMLSALMIQAGFAWTDGTAYRLFSELEDDARIARRGMWGRPALSEQAPPAGGPLPRLKKKPR